MVLFGSLPLRGLSFRPHVCRGDLVLPPYFRIYSELVPFLWVGCIRKLGDWDFSGWVYFS